MKRKALDNLNYPNKRAKYETKHIELLPNEIMYTVLGYLDIYTCIRFLTTCAYLYKTFWREDADKIRLYRLKRPYEYFNYIAVNYWIKHVANWGEPGNIGFSEFLKRYHTIPLDKAVVAMVDRNQNCQLSLLRVDDLFSRAYFNTIAENLILKEFKECTETACKIVSNYIDLKSLLSTVLLNKQCPIKFDIKPKIHKFHDSILVYANNIDMYYKLKYTGGEGGQGSEIEACSSSILI